MRVTDSITCESFSSTLMDLAAHVFRGQYRTARPGSSIGNVSTRHRVGSEQHRLCQYRTSRREGAA
eukprot:3033126-Rhodomonas_salina.1